MKMMFFQNKNAGLIADFICCILLGSAVCSAFLPLIGLDVTIGDCILIMTADLLLIFFFTRRWWIFPAIIATAAVIVLSIFAITNDFSQILNSLISFTEWFFSGFPDTPDGINFWHIALASLIAALPVSALAYLFFRKLFFFPVLPPISLTLVLWLFFDNSKLIIGALILLLSVIFISMAKMTGNKSNRHLPESDRIPGIYNQVSAIIIIPFIMLLTFIFVPAVDGELRFNPLVNIVNDFSDLVGLTKDKPAQGTFSISNSGFSPLGHRLGGDVELNNKIVLRVKTTTPANLTGAVFDTYTGSQWHDSHEIKRYRLSSIFWNNQLQEAFGLDKPLGGNDAKTLFDAITVPASFDISSSFYGTTLFTAGQMHTITSDYFDSSDVYFNRQSEVFVSGYKRWLLRYKFDTLLFNKLADGFDTNMYALETALKDSFDPHYENVKSIYLQLPESLPDSVYAVAKAITSHAVSPYQKAAAIERWLSQNCRYTLTPGSPPIDRDFVDYFLETREGYCVYYASAMAVLSRCAGLPSRYVTGFSLKRNPLSELPVYFVATNATAHAWTEVYFKGIGWVPFDATGWNYFENAETENMQIGQAGNANIPSENIFTADGSSFGAQEASEDVINTGITAVIVLLILFAATIFIIAFIRFVMLLRGAEGYYKHLCRKYAGPENIMNACYKRIIVQAGFLGIRLNADDTITSFARRIDKQLGGNLMSLSCEPVVRMRFALILPLDEEIKNLCVFSIELEKRIRHILGLRGYIWHRLLLGR